MCELASAVIRRDGATPNMTPETIQAIRDSISHWERMRDDPDVRVESPGRMDCPLCQMFRGRDECGLCPVNIATDAPYCEGTPYWNASAAWHKRRKDPDAWRRAAQLEIDFLRSLLPGPSAPVMPNLLDAVEAVLDTYLHPPTDGVDYWYCDQCCARGDVGEGRDDLVHVPAGLLARECTIGIMHRAVVRVRASGFMGRGERGGTA